MSTPLILLDGGLGTTLTDQHAQIFNPETPLWSSHLLLSPSGRATLLAAQKRFREAGAELILSATYQASFEGFKLSGVDDEREAGGRMRGGVRVARAAVECVKEGGLGVEGGKGKVVLGLGAYGATMVPGQEYSGLYDEEHSSQEGLREWHFKRIQAFMPGAEDEEERNACWEGVDFIAFETLPRLDEVLAVREVMGKVDGMVGKGGEREFWISCVFPGEGHCLPDGSRIGEVVKAMLAGKWKRPMGVGINCTRVGKVEELVGEFEEEVKRLLEIGEVEEWPSLVVYPDGTKGEVYNTSTKEWMTSEVSEESLVSCLHWKAVEVR